jgi:predicted CXXCH cytochrome family protein
MKSMFHLAKVLALVLPISVAASALSGEVRRPDQAIPQGGCVTAECHTTVKQHRVIHGPVNVNACDACHQVVDVTQHTFRLARDESQLCTFCHQLDLPAQGVIHQPLKDGQCIQCHDPHGGTTNQFLRGISMRQMCQSCHEDVVGDKKMVHGPAAADACGACHRAHVAPFPKLLTAEGRDLCLSCHTEMGQQMTRVAVVHKPAQEDCLQCHDAHASDHTMQIRQAPKDLCAGCHEAIGTKARNAPHQHSVVLEEQACLNCHTAHGADLASLVKAEPMDLCMSCHQQEIKVEPGRTVAAMSQVLDPNMIKHGPIRDGNCSGCHDVHGAEVSRLLSSSYPEPFYQAFSLDNYDLCFSCHDSRLVQTEQARGLTRFRNGEQNLHFVHVNREKGRNCRACHSTHASTNDLHVAESVPFGNWQMPINFTKGDTGGSCSPGCHRPYDYDREQPVTYGN